MKNIKNTKYIVAITVVIAGLLMTSAVGISANTSNENDTNVSECYLSAPVTKIVTSQARSIDGPAALFDSTIIYDSDYDDYHPTVAGDLTGRFFTGFDFTSDEIDYYPEFFYSLDAGITWAEAGYFPDSLGSEFPDADSNNNGFYGTFSAPLDYPAQLWALEATLGDPPIAGWVWDWAQYNLMDFRHNSISSYTRAEEDWNWGGMATVGYFGYDGADVEGCPYIFYPNEPDSGVIGWTNGVENCVHSDCAIDEKTEMSYAVYDREDVNKLRLRKDDFSQFVPTGDPPFPVHPSVWNKDIGDGSVHLMNMSIEANNNMIVIVAEAEGNIVCLYSSNGGTSFTQSDVETGAAFPEVFLSPDNTFVCSYIKDGAIYTETSVDGVAWAEQEVLSDNQVNVGYGAHDLCKGINGVYGIWEDTRNADIDIFFAQAIEAEIPILEITGITGGIGVTATIENTGNAPATNVNTTLTVQGGILGLIDKEVNLITESLDDGATIEISTGLILGLGSISIAVHTECDEGSSDSEEADGTVLLFIVRI